MRLLPVIARPLLLAATLLLIAPGFGAAQEGTRIGLTATKQDRSQPVEVTSDRLDISQYDNKARFSGNVFVSQGAMRMTAAVADVEYGENALGETEIRWVHATGGVTLFNGVEAAEGKEATYSLTSGEVVMTGDVVVTQGKNAVAGDTLTVNLDTGIGVMEGKVRVLFDNSDKPQADKPAGASQ